MSQLTHITDVGSPEGNGCDSTLRIMTQYEQVGTDVHVVSAGKSPLHVAFAGTTILSRTSQHNAQQVLNILGETKIKNSPYGLNCAPRNAAKNVSAAGEDFIYRISSKDLNTRNFVLYGPEVLAWVLDFLGRDVRFTVEKILSLQDIYGNCIIHDTSRGSQFRSAEYLPLIHILESQKKLDDVSQRESVDISTIPSKIEYLSQGAIILPPDEFGNSRLLFHRDFVSKIKKSFSFTLDGQLFVFQKKDSLTEVTPGTLALWPSSNHLPDENLKVMNIGTRFSPGQTKLSDPQIGQLASMTANYVGSHVECNHE